MRKLTAAVICGGQNDEHEVSLRSAYYVYQNLNRSYYQPVILGIDKKGGWHFAKKYEDLIIYQKPFPKMKRNAKRNSDAVVLIKNNANNTKAAVFNLKTKKKISAINIVFPLIHGTFGEDGCLQSYLELLGIPYVGSGVLASAIGMDKEVTKRLLQKEKISTAKFLTLDKFNPIKYNQRIIKQAVKYLKFPIFVKPSCLGSSVGISRANNYKELQRAITLAFRYGNKILLEEYIKGREIECSVLGNHQQIASLPGEIKPRHIFYDYEAKYIDPKGADLITPAVLDKKTIKAIQNISLKTSQALGCRGMVRVDGFLTKANKFIVSEVNTIPGFTDISMYPKLWQVSGLPYGKLLDKLIQSAMENYKIMKL